MVGVAATFAANDFYRLCLKLDPAGLPTPQQMKRFAPLFTKELAWMIEDARTHREKLMRENPSARQPWRGGNLFTSLGEGITFYGIGYPVVQGDTATIPMDLGYREQGKVTRWIDVIVLRRSGRHWLVDDIFLNATWALTSGASLRTRLLLPMMQDVPAAPAVPEDGAAAEPS